MGLKIKEITAGGHDDVIKRIKDDLSEYGILVMKNQVYLIFH